MHRVESLLAARLFTAPQLVDGRIYFISNLSGRLSLYVMDEGGSVPEPLLPPEIALQNPELVFGELFRVLPRHGLILLMLDRDGDENYQPMAIPLQGGYPEPLFGDALADARVSLQEIDEERGLVFLGAQSRKAPITTQYRGDLATRQLTRQAESGWGFVTLAWDGSTGRQLLTESYSAGDTVLYQLREGDAQPEPLFGTPLAQRAPGEAYPPLGVFSGALSPSRRGVLLVSAVHDDRFGAGYLAFDRPQHIEPLTVQGLRHGGDGVMEQIESAGGDRYLVSYNIDGASWVYLARFDEDALRLAVVQVLIGDGVLAGGVAHGVHHDEKSGRTVAAFTTATQPAQIVVVGDGEPRFVTRERVLGIEQALLARGEDASFASHDGLRISARLYLPAAALGYSGPRPVVVYVHGGPQGQERPDFAWFSMPLIQLLTLRGFAVFVPNTRGSTGYGMSYMKRVDNDWGGADRLDHVHAMTQVLPRDPRLDVTRAAVVGRSYGGYMTLTLAMRHPELWKAAIDMFGPYDLVSFIDRLPATWKPYFALAVGDPATEAGRAFLRERSPRTYAHQLTAPMLVIQGANDPRVVLQESRDVVDELKTLGKDVDLLVFDDEGHDVLKFANRVRCYNAIADFFARHLKP